MFSERFSLSFEGLKKSPALLPVLCQGPNGAYGTTQYFAKAYPGLRQLALLRDIGDQAVVSSICAKSIDPASAAYGYGPAVEALVRAMAPRLNVE